MYVHMYIRTYVRIDMLVHFGWIETITYLRTYVVFQHFNADLVLSAYMWKDVQMF